jgi:hypothetical protein
VSSINPGMRLGRFDVPPDGWGDAHSTCGTATSKGIEVGFGAKTRHHERFVWRKMGLRPAIRVSGSSDRLHRMSYSIGPDHAATIIDVGGDGEGAATRC